MFIIFHVWHPHRFYVLRHDPELGSLVFNMYSIHALKASNLCMGFVLILTESEIALNSPIEFGLYFGCFFINGFHLLYNMEPTKKMKPNVTQTTSVL